MTLPVQSLWKATLKESFQECVRKGAAGMCSRERPRMKGLRPDKGICEKVEEWLEEVWEGQDHTASVTNNRLWRLNCLIYCGKTSVPFMNHKHIELRRGARLVLQIGKESKHASNTSDEVEAEQLDLEDQRDWAPIETDVATRDQSWEAKLVRCIKALEGRLSGVNRTLNLISAALTRTRMRSGRRFSRRERVSQTWEAVPTVTSKKPAGRALESGKGAIFGTKQDPKGPAGQTPALGRLQTKLKTLQTR